VQEKCLAKKGKKPMGEEKYENGHRNKKYFILSTYEIQDAKV